MSERHDKMFQVFGIKISTTVNMHIFNTDVLYNYTLTLRSIYSFFGAAKSVQRCSQGPLTLFAKSRR